MVSRKGTILWESKMGTKLQLIIPQVARRLFCPKNFIRYNNILKSKYPRYGPAARNSSSHLKLVHKMNVPSALELVEMLEETVPKGNKKVSRKEMQDMREKIINFYLTKILSHLKHST